MQIKFSFKFCYQIIQVSDLCYKFLLKIIQLLLTDFVLYDFLSLNFLIRFCA